MRESDFAWDEYFSRASFDEITKRSPELSSRSPPSAFNPDKSKLYLSSLDDNVRTDNIEELRSALDEIKRSYLAAQKAHPSNHLKLALARIDFTTVCGLMDALVESPEDFSDPDHLLET